MKNTRYSQISESEESNSSSSRSKSPISKSTREESSDSSPSDSSSDSENVRPEPVAVKSPTISKKEESSSSQLQKYACSRHLTDLKIHEEITEEDDICLLEVPKTFDASTLQGKVIHFEQKTKIKVNNSRYVIEPCVEDVRPINVLTKSLKVIHPLAYLKLLDYTKIKSNREVLNTEKFTSSLPNIKIRHPLFGPQYEDKITLYKRIERNEVALKKMKKKKKQKREVSQDATTEIQPSTSAKKNKTKQRYNSVSINFPVKTEPESDRQESNEVEESIFALLESHIVENNKKKHRNNIEQKLTRPSLNSSNDDDNIEVHSVKTKTKRHKNSLHEGMEEYEPSLNDKLKQKNNIKKEKTDTEEVDLNEDSFEHKNKHRKKTIKTEMNSKEAVTVESRSEKKKKRQSIGEQDSSTYFDLIGRQGIVNNSSFLNENKRKRKKSIKEEIKNSMNNTLSFEEDTNRNKKRKQRSSFKNEENDIDANGSYREESFDDNNKKCREKKNNIVNSTVIPDLQLPVFEFDVSEIRNNEAPAIVKKDKLQHQLDEASGHQKMKNKKIKQESVEFFANQSANDDQSFEGNANVKYYNTSMKKVKKEKNDEDNYSSSRKRRKTEGENENKNASTLSLLSKIKSELNTSTKLKNKKKSVS